MKRADAEATMIKGPQKDEKNDNKESGGRGYTNQGFRRGKRRATIIKSDPEAIQINGPQREVKGDKRGRMQRLYRPSARRGRKRATIQRADPEAIQIKDRQREEKGNYRERANADAIQIEGPHGGGKGQQ